MISLSSRQNFAMKDQKLKRKFKTSQVFEKIFESNFLLRY